jgi:hypothetical protein
VPPVIDLWAPIVPSREIATHASAHFPEAMLGYLRLFFRRPPPLEPARAMVAALACDDDAILARLDEAEIVSALVTGFDERSTAGDTFVSNESVAALAERHPGRFLAFAGADVMRGVEAVRDFERWVRERGDFAASPCGRS